MQKPNRIGWAGCTNRNRILAPRPGLEPGTYGLTVFRPGTETHSSEFWKLRNPMNFLDSDVVACVAVFHRVPGFCEISHARLHRNYTEIFTTPLHWQGFAGATRRRFSYRPRLVCRKSRRWRHGDYCRATASRAGDYASRRGSRGDPLEPWDARPADRPAAVPNGYRVK